MFRKSKILIALGAALFITAAALLVPNHALSRPRHASYACLNNLRQFDSAKQQWALENHKKIKDTVTMDDLRPYLGRGSEGKMPQCPLGGVYKIGRLGDSPSCSIHGRLE